VLGWDGCQVYRWLMTFVYPRVVSKLNEVFYIKKGWIAADHISSLRWIMADTTIPFQLLAIHIQSFLFPVGKFHLLKHEIVVQFEIGTKITRPSFKLKTGPYLPDQENVRFLSTKSRTLEKIYRMKETGRVWNFRNITIEANSNLRSSVNEWENERIYEFRL